MANPTLQTEVLNRLRNVKGHVAGIERMVEEEQACSNILIQLSAVRSSIEKIGVFILENNAIECLGADLDKLEEKQKIQDVVKQMLTFLK
jgi:DNA-binding FrmR family transcriptional regulator